MDNATAITTPKNSDPMLVPRFLSLVPENARRLDMKLLPFAQSALVQTERDLSPASETDFRNELTGCLALVAPAGFTDGARREWLIAARGTLHGIPSDLLAQGCSAARRSCDHPAKIIPAILREIEESWGRRKASRSRVLAAIAKMEAPVPNEPRCTAEEAADIIKRAGLKMSA